MAQTDRGIDYLTAEEMYSSPSLDESIVQILKVMSGMEKAQIQARINDRNFLSNVLYNYSKGINYQSGTQAIEQAIDNVSRIAGLQGPGSYLSELGNAYVSSLQVELQGAQDIETFDTNYADTHEKLIDITNQAAKGEYWATPEARELVKNFYDIKKSNVLRKDPVRRGLWKQTADKAQNVSAIIGILDQFDVEKFDEDRPMETRGVQLSEEYEDYSIKGKYGERIRVKDKISKAQSLFKAGQYDDSYSELTDILAMPDVKRRQFAKAVKEIHPFLQQAETDLNLSTTLEDTGYEKFKGMGIGTLKDYFLGTDDEILSNATSVKDTFNALSDWLYSIIEEESTGINPLGLIPGVGRFLDDHPEKADMDKWLSSDNESNFKWLVDDALTSGSFGDDNLSRAVRSVYESRKRLAQAYKEFTGEELLSDVQTSGYQFKFTGPTGE